VKSHYPSEAPEHNEQGTLIKSISCTLAVMLENYCFRLFSFFLHKLQCRLHMHDDMKHANQRHSITNEGNHTTFPNIS
jgi:hypothetical protein